MADIGKDMQKAYDDGYHEGYQMGKLDAVGHGRWEPRTDAIGFVRCSVCRDCNIYGEWADGEKWSYCPNCGAKMDLED